MLGKSYNEKDVADRATVDVRVQILGPFRLWRDGVEVDVGSRMQRCALLLLAAKAGSPVSMSEMIDLLWGEVPPPSAVNTVHKYVGTLRRLFEPQLSTRSTGRWLLRNGSGYRFNASPDVLDLSEFRAAADAARQKLADGGEDAALHESLAALRLWYGPAGDQLPHTPTALAVFAALDREYLQLAADTGRLARKLKHPQAVLDPLWRATEVGALHEPVHAELVANLALAGHHSEALSVYRTVEARLQDELGIEPSPLLRSASQLIAPAKDPAARRPSPPPTPPAEPRARPAQLPPRLASFVGRAELLAKVRQLAGTPRSAPLIIAFDGMPGVGKTALALQAAHQLLPHYPDGQLHLDLRGFAADGHPLTPEAALCELISGLGVDQGQIPPGRQAMAGLYRTLLRGRRMLIVLDDASSTEQLVDLLPGAESSAALITSRSRLTALRTAVGAHLVPVELPSPSEAHAQLAAHFGDHLDHADPRAVEALARSCAQLPLALAHAAVAATGHASVQPGDAAEVLKFTETRVNESFSRSYRRLSAPAANLFRSLAPDFAAGDAFTAGDAAALLVASLETARSLLAELHHVGLVQASRPGCYRWHTLVRAFAVAVPGPETKAAPLAAHA